MFVLGVVEVTMKYFEHQSVFDPPTMDHVNCPKYWWRNVLYINTLFPVEDMVIINIWIWRKKSTTNEFIGNNLIKFHFAVYVMELVSFRWHPILHHWSNYFNRWREVCYLIYLMRWGKNIIPISTLSLQTFQSSIEHVGRVYGFFMGHHRFHCIRQQPYAKLWRSSSVIRQNLWQTMDSLGSISRWNVGRLVTIQNKLQNSNESGKFEWNSVYYTFLSYEITHQ